jgi:hypothetical protein
MEPWLLQEVILATLKVPQESPLYWIAQDLAGLLARGDKMDVVQLAKEYSCDSIQQLRQEEPWIARALRQGFDTFYMGSASDQSSAVENLLCDMDLECEGTNLIIRKSGGY